MPGVKIKGRKMGSLKALKTALKKKGAGPITFVPEDGIIVRFLTEPEEWFGFNEHYDAGLKSYYPCIEGKCPGCEQGLSTSFRYLTNAVDRSTDKAIALKLAQDAANRVVMKFDKYDTIMDRDYEITRSGTGFDTIYDVSPEAPDKSFRPSKYELFDLEELVEKAWERAFGDEEDEDEEDEPRRPKKKVGKSVAKKSVAKKVPTKKTATVKKRSVGHKRFVRR